MARIEEQTNPVADLQDEVARLKKNLKRKQSKKKISCASCTAFILVIIVALVFLGAFVLAKTGLFNVPFLSQGFYHEPTPSYLVESYNVKEPEQEILKQLKAEVLAQAAKQQDLSNLIINIRLTEKQLTAIIQEKISQNQSASDRLQYSQLAVREDDLEFFIKTKNNLVFTLNFVPEIKNNQVDIKISKARLGELPLPNFLGNYTLAYFTEKSLNMYLDSLAQHGQIKNVTVLPGVMLIDLVITNPQEFL